MVSRLDSRTIIGIGYGGTEPFVVIHLNRINGPLRREVQRPMINRSDSLNEKVGARPPFR